MECRIHLQTMHAIEDNVEGISATGINWEFLTIGNFCHFVRMVF